MATTSAGSRIAQLLVDENLIDPQQLDYAERVRDALIRRETSFEIRRICNESTGIISLLEGGIVKAAQGQTSFGEILRTLPRLEKPRPLAELHRLLGVRT